jgi:hypothetical protein
MIRAISVATFILWLPLVLLAGELLLQELFPFFLRGIHRSDVLLGLTALVSALVAILFAALALARNTRSAAAQAFIAAAPGAIFATFLLWSILTQMRDPTLVGWLFLTDLLLTIMLPGAWFIVWRSRDRGDDEA